MTPHGGHVLGEHTACRGKDQERDRERARTMSEVHADPRVPVHFTVFVGGHQ